MKTKKLLLFIAFSALLANVKAQQFERTYGGAGDDKAYSVVQSGLDNGYVMAGYTESFAAPNSTTPRDGYIVRTDVNGNVIWANTYGTAEANESFRKIINTDDGGWLAVGWAKGDSTVPVGDGKSVYAVKININGGVMWSRTYDISTSSTLFETGVDVVQSSITTHNNVFHDDYFIGAEVFGTVDSSKSVAIRIDANDGHMIWFNDYNGTFNLGTGIVALDGGQLMISGGTRQNSQGGYDYNMTKLDGYSATGDPLPFTTSSTNCMNYGGAGDEAAYNLLRSHLTDGTDNGFLLAGSSNSFTTPACFYVKTDVQGTVEWEKTFTMTNRSQRTFSVIEDAASGNYVTAIFDQTSPSDFYIYKMAASDGHLIWGKKFGGTGPTDNDVCYSVIQNNANGYAVIGYTDSFGQGDYDFYLVVTDTSGNILNTCHPGTSVIPDDSVVVSTDVAQNVTRNSLTLDSAFTTDTARHIPGVGICPNAQFVTVSSTICQNDCISFVNLSTGPASSWSWSFPGSSTLTSTAQNPTNICYPSAGLFGVSLTASNSYGSITTSEHDYITVNPTPTPVITSNDDFNVCPGETIILSSNYVTGNTWQPGNINAQSITVTSAGTYSLTVNDNGCTASTSVNVTTQNCCVAANNPLIYTPINSNLLINTNTAWANKYYIAPGVIVTVDGVTLDLTNVDIVFGECAGINFVHGANLRATNSVFRSCDETQSWRGLNFVNSHGVVNECTFKNAYIAADISNSPVRFTNNLFLNSLGAIDLRGTYTESITGNTFTIDNTPITYLDFDCTPNAGIFYGITATNTIYGDVIAQNDFNYSASVTSQNKQYIGIFDNGGSNAKISSNHFSNMYRSIDITGSSSVSIDNNTMEVTRANSNTEFQVRLGSKGNQQSTNIDMRNNTLTYNTTSNSTHSAIYAQLINSSAIRNNLITGFETAVQLWNVTNCNITENTINDAKSFGIAANNTVVGNNGSQVNISCNEIKMDLNSIAQNAPNVVGIYYSQASNGTKNIIIRDNCVLETTHAIWLDVNNTINGNINNALLPNVTGNFLYSYRRFGVLINGFNGPNNSGPSKNTFISNNFPNPNGATDIGSSSSYTCDANYGILRTTNNISLGNNNNRFNSIAACGLQIASPQNQPNNQIGTNEICTNSAIAFRIAQVNDSGEATLTLNYDDMLLSAGENYFAAASNAMNVLSINTTNTEQDRLYNTVIGQNELDIAESALFYHYYLVSTKQYNLALAHLPYLAVIGEDAADFMEVQRISLGVLINNASPVSISSTDITSLERIAENSSKYSSAATDLLQAALTGYDYDFDEMGAIQDVNLPTVEISGNNQLSLFPNPAIDAVTIQYTTLNPDNCELKVTDVTGRIVLAKKLGFYYDQEQIDISNLTGGVYLFTIYENNTPVAKSKLVKE